jgi:hypothetical protein
MRFGRAAMVGAVVSRGGSGVGGAGVVGLGVVGAVVVVVCVVLVAVVVVDPPPVDCGATVIVNCVDPLVYVIGFPTESFRLIVPEHVTVVAPIGYVIPLR